MEAKHRESLLTVQATADERLESERQRLNIRLRNVESSVMELKVGLGVSTTLCYVLFCFKSRRWKAASQHRPQACG